MKISKIMKNNNLALLEHGFRKLLLAGGKKFWRIPGYMSEKYLPIVILRINEYRLTLLHG